MGNLDWFIEMIARQWSEGWLGKLMATLAIILALLFVVIIGSLLYAFYCWLDQVGREKRVARVTIVSKSWQESYFIPVTISSGDPVIVTIIQQYVPAHGVIIFRFRNRLHSLGVTEGEYADICPEDKRLAEYVIGRFSRKVRFIGFLEASLK